MPVLFALLHALGLLPLLMALPVMLFAYMCLSLMLSSPRKAPLMMFDEGHHHYIHLVFLLKSHPPAAIFPDSREKEGKESPCPLLHPFPAEGSEKRAISTET
jgi:hypothetical protein